MSLLDEVIGAVAAVEAVKKLDPNASLIEEGIAAFAGFKGVGAVEEHLAEKAKEKAQAANADEDTEEDNPTA
jgi:hypothetical protein